MKKELTSPEILIAVAKWLTANPKIELILKDKDWKGFKLDDYNSCIRYLMSYFEIESHYNHCIHARKTNVGGYINYKESVVDLEIPDIYMIDVFMLYPTVTSMLIGRNELEFSHEGFAWLYPKLLKSRALAKKTKANIIDTLIKLLLNYTYGALQNPKSCVTCEELHKIPEEVKHVFDHIFLFHPEVVYIDTDEIFVRGKDVAEKIQSQLQSLGWRTEISYDKYRLRILKKKDIRLMDETGKNTLRYR